MQSICVVHRNAWSLRKWNIILGGVWKNASLFHVLLCIFSDCMGTNLNCISGLLLPTICTAYARKSLQNQTQLSFKSSCLILWIYAMMCCVKILTSRYVKEFKTKFNRNVISTINTHFPGHILLLLVTYQSGLKHSSYLKIEAGPKNWQDI